MTPPQSFLVVAAVLLTICVVLFTYCAVSLLKDIIKAYRRRAK